MIVGLIFGKSLSAAGMIFSIYVSPLVNLELIFAFHISFAVMQLPFSVI